MRKALALLLTACLTCSMIGCRRPAAPTNNAPSGDGGGGAPFVAKELNLKSPPALPGTSTQVTPKTD